MQNIFKLNDKEVINVEIDNLDMADYPDFVDAYISEATFKDTNKQLSDNELAFLFLIPSPRGRFFFVKCIVGAL